MKRVGGVLCLDFLNTVNAWPNPTRDDLLSPADLSGWAADSGLPLDRPPTMAEVGAARTLRKRLFEIFSLVLEGHPPTGEGMQWLLAEAAASGKPPVASEPASTQVELSWPAPLSPEDLRSCVAFSAVVLLVRGPLSRVKACASCGWFFVDTSRNGTRRWCSMEYCGSRSKAMTYAIKHRASRTDGVPPRTNQVRSQGT